MATSSGLILQICLIMALSLCCKGYRYYSISGQVSLAWSMALCKQELYTWPRVLYERWRDARPELLPGCFHTSSDSYFTASTSRKHVTLVAEGSYHLQLIRSDLDFTLWSALNRACISHAPCTPIIRILCQMLWPAAFLMHPKFVAIAVDAVVA